MPSPPKIFFNRGIHFVTTSVEKDFIFPPNPLVREVILKSIAQAQALHDVIIADVFIQPTHCHFILQVIDPSDAADFMERFKTESAHAVNGLLGRKKSTVWCEGYDSPLIPDLDTLVQKIGYSYGNAAQDNLTDTIDEFPGFNTFSIRNAMACGNLNLAPVLIPTYQIPRPAFTPIEGNKKLLLKDYRKLRDELVKDRKVIHFRVSPNTIFTRFGVEDEKEIRRWNQRIVDNVRAREEEARQRRKLEGKTVLGAERLLNTPIGAHYLPERSGRRMLVHSVHKTLRIKTIRWMRDLIQRGKDALKQWRLGNFFVPYPEGLFPPTGIRLVEPIGW